MAIFEDEECISLQNMLEAFVVPVVMTTVATYCLEDFAESQELVHEGKVDSTN